ncbi:hypothetical protein HMPREF9413_3191 [Paenibacillus sp. HGF7]|nr:hypothetical protein HMPREF9413_3191 [Paenibacillus sp. HGF7]
MIAWQIRAFLLAFLWLFYQAESQNLYKNGNRTHEKNSYRAKRAA